MAQRFGGKYSPDGQAAGEPAPMVRAERPGLAERTPLYFVTPLPFAIRAFTGPAGGLVLGLAATALLALACWVTREGILAQAAYDARRVARRPALPRKILGSVLTGAGLFMGGQMVEASLLHSTGFAVAGFVLHLLAFGPDPLRDKGMEGVDQFQTDRIARAVDEAETYLSAMQDAILRAGDGAIEARVDRFANAARSLFRAVEADPGDLTAARKYMTVYLMGARDAAAKFADLYARNRDPQARADFEGLLTDLETHFADRTKALLTDNKTDLDVEISVLRDRLKFES